VSGGAAEAAAERKMSKYAYLAQAHIFVPLACSRGTFWTGERKKISVLSDLVAYMAHFAKDMHTIIATAPLFCQRLSTIILRFNAFPIQGTFVIHPPPENYVVAFAANLYVYFSHVFLTIGI